MINFDIWFYAVSAFLFVTSIFSASRLLSKPRHFARNEIKLFLVIVSCCFAIRMFFHVYFWAMSDYNVATQMMEFSRYATTPEYQYSAILRSLLMPNELLTTEPIYAHLKFWVIEIPVFAFGALVWSLPLLPWIFKPRDDGNVGAF